MPDLRSPRRGDTDRDRIAESPAGACDEPSAVPPPADPGAARKPAWVRESDEYARPIMELITRFEPEKLSTLGYPGAAEQITRLPPDRPQERIAALDQAIRTLGDHLAEERHAAVRVDLESMITLLTWEVDLLRLESERLLPYFNLAQTVFSGFLSLLTTGTRTKSAAAVRTRLRRYAGLEEGYVPLARQATTLIRTGLSRGGLLGPCRDAVLEDLRAGPRLLAAVQELLEEHRITGCAQAFSKLRRQLAGYDTFLRQEVLPRCRDDFRLPAELYAARLLSHGVELPVEELSRRAEAACEELRRQLEATASRLADQRGWPREPFPAVLRRLEQERLVPEKILSHYRGRRRRLEELIDKAGFATLPRHRRPRIRFAGKAESALLPFPHFRWPPFFGNRGTVGELVLPAPRGRSEVSDPGGWYATEAASWAVAAHEGLPGHALQIGRLLEPDVSLARGPLGFTYAGLEGWAVYAGSEISPELPPAARFITLHHDLRRAACAFLDPALHHGYLTPEQASCFLRTHLGLTARAARQALWRTTVWSPGQATSYFYGHSQLAALRTAVECRLGAAFDRRRYHDFLLSQGLLPLSLLRRWVLEQIIPERRRAA